MYTLRPLFRKKVYSELRNLRKRARSAEQSVLWSQHHWHLPQKDLSTAPHSPTPDTSVHTAIPPGALRNTYISSDKAFLLAVKNAPTKVRTGPTIWTYGILKSALSSDPLSDLSAVKGTLVKFCTGGFHRDTIYLFKLAWMFAFIKNDRVTRGQ